VGALGAVRGCESSLVGSSRISAPPGNTLTARPPQTRRSTDTQEFQPHSSMKQADQRITGPSHLIGVKAVARYSYTSSDCLFALVGRRLSLGLSGSLPLAARHALRASCIQLDRGAQR